MTTCGSVAKIAASHACPDPVEAVLRLPLHHIRLPANIPAGFSPFRLLAIADVLRNAGGDVADPVLVRRLNDEDWLVVEGRHRVLASWVAGCSHVLCEVVP